MEQIPDMDALLDEVENSETSSGRSVPDWSRPPTFQTFPPPQILSTITNSSVPRFLEETCGSGVRSVEAAPFVPTPEPSPSPSPPPPEDHPPDKPKLPEVSTPEETIEAVEISIPDSSDFDDALERYLNQFPDEEDQIVVQKGVEEDDELMQAAEAVAEEVFVGAIEDCEIALTSSLVYGECPTQKDKDQEEQTEMAREATLSSEEETAITEEIREETEVGKSFDEMTISEEESVAFESSQVEESEPQPEDMVEPSTIEVVCVGDQPSSDEFAEIEDSTELAEDPVNAPSIATIHNLEQESSSRLTESELLLGKLKPYWIPDGDCDSCMLCSSRFSLISRRHHCRACGRVLCSACCSEKTVLEYMKTEEEGKKPVPARVCRPCIATLTRIEEYEKERSEESSTRVQRGVLKQRSDTTMAEQDNEPSTSDQQSIQPRRSVTFRDGVNPGSSSSTSGQEERSTAMKPKKKSRKRPSIVRRVTELKVENEMESYLPESDQQTFSCRLADGSYSRLTFEQTAERLKESEQLTVLVRKNLLCHIQASIVNSQPVWSIASDGFSAVGVDELLFVWTRRDPYLVHVQELIRVLERTSEYFLVCLDAGREGVKQVILRIPRLFSSKTAVYPLPKHIWFFRPTQPYFGTIRTPSAPFLVACFLADSELSWTMACPNRVLFRLGLKYGVFPCPFVNQPERETVFSPNTTSTVLKVFTDFRNWSFRMAQIPGSTLTLSNETTILNIPRDAQETIRSVIKWNKSMLAWCCETNAEADSHLVCEENDGLYSTHVLSKGTSRDATGASFVILDGGLKTSSQLQVSVVEDGVAIRVQAEQFRVLCESLSSNEPSDIVVKDSTTGSELHIRWVDNDHNSCEFSVRSAIDGLYLEDKYQYGLSQDRVLTAVLEVQTVPGMGVRLSHVYNLLRGRLDPVDEPKVFSIVELLSREATSLLGNYLSSLLNMDIHSISLRFYAHQDSVAYDVSPWLGLEQEHSKYLESMDQLIPVLINCAEFLSSPLHVEFTLSFVSTVSPIIP